MKVLYLEHRSKKVLKHCLKAAKFKEVEPFTGVSAFSVIGGKKGRGWYIYVRYLN